MPDGSLQVVGAFAGIVSLIWNVVNALQQKKYKNYENEFKSVETLILETRKKAIQYWMAEQRDTSVEIEILISLDDLGSKLTSLQNSRIIPSAPALDAEFIALRQAVTNHPFKSSTSWATDPGRCSDIRTASDAVLHRFLKVR